MHSDHTERFILRRGDVSAFALLARRDPRLRISRALAEAIGLVAGLHDVAVVRDPVDQRGGLFKEPRLLGRQALGTHAIALTLVERQLMGEPVDLGLTPDEFALLLNEQMAKGFGIQVVEVGGKNQASIM